jgi:hypothetical protein
MGGQEDKVNSTSKRFRSLSFHLKSPQYEQLPAGGALPWLSIGQGFLAGSSSPLPQLQPQFLYWQGRHFLLPGVGRHQTLLLPVYLTLRRSFPGKIKEY